MSAIKCQLQQLQQVNDHVYHIKLDTEQPFSYAPGQYLQVVMSEQDKRPFSIASAPYESHLELHIGATQSNSYAMEVIEQLTQQGELTVEVGLGQAQLRTDSERPIILLAGGTGFSYVQSIARQLAQLQVTRPVYLYWGGKSEQSLYAHQQMMAWQQQENFHYIPVLEHPEADWQGERGLVHQVVMAKHADLNKFDIYVAGHFDMVKAVRDDFIAQGAELDHMYADAFAYLK